MIFLKITIWVWLWYDNDNDISSDDNNDYIGDDAITVTDMKVMKIKMIIILITKTF